MYDDLLSNYNKLVRPVVNVTDALTVRIKLKLSQLIDVVRDLKMRSVTDMERALMRTFSVFCISLSEQNLKNQIMTSNLWVEQSWYDYKLKWDPREVRRRHLRDDWR